MEQPHKPNSKQPPKVAASPKAKKNQPKTSAREALDNFLTRHARFTLLIPLALTLLFSLLLFDSKVSPSGDDSFYIIRASAFIRQFEYPAFQGPLYPIYLGIFIGLAGFNLTLLKTASLLCMLGVVIVTHFAFKNRVPASVGLLILLFFSVNSFILGFASQTYSEAFYMLIQALLLLAFFRLFIDREETLPLKKDIGRHALLAGILLALVLTRSVGFTAFFAVAGYFLLRGQWRNLLLAIGTFALIYMAFTGLKYLLWNDAGLQFSSQSSGLLQKDFYNTSRGQEDLAGFLNRLVVNSNLYISRHFYTITGFRPMEIIQVKKPALTIFFYLLFLGGLVLSYMKNRWIFFTGLLTLIFLLATFIILQTSWDQYRLIIPAIPFMMLLPLAFFYYLSDFPKLKVVYWIIPILGIFMIGQGFTASVAKSKEMSKNTGKYDGLTPDWKHYIMASEWVAKNLDKKELVACRKPSISFIYGNGRPFYGIMSVTNADTKGFFRTWKKDKLPLMAYDRAILTKTQLRTEVVEHIRRSVAALILYDSLSFIIYDFPDSLKSTILAEFATAKLKPISSPDSLEAIVFSATKPPILVIPDSLLLPLIKNGVTHVMTANLRENPNKKGGKTINTVERYMSTISDKYPALMTLVHKIGDDNDEPAAIYKLNYEKQKAVLMK